ncbi:hypothetical protein [Saccharothrix lopnurensis]|uniref:Uncharacterized protein n=1 Tax=Saccharothrix lopnurensis TaxID=1670621 RepID=A0ABW1PH56_9PSEU
MDTERHGRHRVVDGGRAPDCAELLTGSLTAIRDGHDAHLSDGVPAVLGHGGRSFADYARGASAAWA